MSRVILYFCHRNNLEDREQNDRVKVEDREQGDRLEVLGLLLEQQEP